MRIRNILFLLTSLSLCNSWAQSNETLSYNGSDKVIKNPERGLSYKAGYVDLFVDNYSYDGSVAYDIKQSFSEFCDNTMSYISLARRGDLDRSVDLPVGYTFDSSVSGLTEVVSNLEDDFQNLLNLTSNRHSELRVDLPCSWNSANESSGNFFKLNYHDNNGNQQSIYYWNGAGFINGFVSFGTWPGNQFTGTGANSYNITHLNSVHFRYETSTNNTITNSLFRVYQNSNPSVEFEYLNIDLTQPVTLELSSETDLFTINVFDEIGLLEHPVILNSNNLVRASDVLDIDVRTELSHDAFSISYDGSSSSVSNNLSGNLTYTTSDHSLDISNTFFTNRVQEQGALNTVELDECFMDKHGISLVELEEYVHFSEANILASQYDIEGNSVTRINSAFSSLKDYGLKAHQVTNSDFRMKANNTLYSVPDDQHFTYLENVMAQTNTEVYSNNESLVALNTVGWIKDQEEANLYRLSPTWLKYKKDKGYLHTSGINQYYSEFLPNEENTLRSSHPRSHYRYSASSFNSDFTGNGFNPNGIAASANIQHYQESVMKKLQDYYPNKKMLVDMTIAWEHKFTYPCDGEAGVGSCYNTLQNSTYIDLNQDEFNKNPNLGYYDDLFSTTYKHIGTICDTAQFYIVGNDTLSHDFIEKTKRDLRVLGRYSDRFWVHGDMPLYFDDQTFESSFSAMSGAWTNNFQFNYDAFKGMLTATGSEQDPYLAVKKLFRFNYTSFDVTYSNSEDIGKNIFEFVDPNGNGAIDKWKKTPMTEDLADAYSLPYSTGYFDTRKNVFEYVRDHLGYRLEVQNMQTAVNGNTLDISVDIQNRGFTSPKNYRSIYVLLMDANGMHIKTETIDANEWLNWSTDLSLNVRKSQVNDNNYTDYTLEADFPDVSYKTHTLEASFTLDGNFNTGQEYQIAVWMPDMDPSLQNSDREVDYAVKFANDPISIGRRGENILGSFIYGQAGINRPSTFVSANTEVINQNTTWSGNVEKDKDITIENGATLTVTGTLKMATNTRIQVLKGGELIVDGGTITSKCNAPWKGIDVFADDDLNQSTSSGQGKVELKNGARLEHAVDAVALIGHDQSDNIAWGTAGGILKASNTTFYNCRRGVEFMAYENWNSTYTTPRRNISTITECTFEFDDNFNVLYGKDAYGENYFPVGVSMWEVDRVLVKGCTFENNINTFNNTDITHNKYDGHAISLFDASPRITAVYTASNQLGASSTPTVKNNFKGFNIGVYSAHADGSNVIMVRDNIFEDNKSGVYMENGSNATISKNSFNVPDLNFGSSTDQVRATGVYLKKTTDFELEQNTFEGNNTNTNFDGGIAIDSMYDHATQNAFIYRNDLNNLGYGFLAYGENGDSYTSSNGSNTPRGLELGCNDFGYTTNNYQDWYIHQDASIAPIQGTGDAPTGNRFSDDPLTNSLYGHIFMGQGSLNITEYFRYNPINHNPEESNPAKVNLVTNTGYEFNRDVDCPTEQAVVIGGGSNEDDLAFDYNDILIDTLEMSELVINFNDILNGGIKPNIMAILLDDTKTSKEVRDKLIEGSPYLSDDVLIGAITRKIPLSQWHLTEVLVWNSRLSSKVLDVLYEVQPLTPYQFNLVKNADNGSQRLLLEMAIHKKEKTIDKKRSDYILKAFSSEDENVNIYDEIIRIYKDVPSVYGVSQCIDAELANKNYTGASNRLDAYLSNHSNASFDDFYNLKIGLRQSGRHWLQLTDNEKRTLNEMEKGRNTFIQSKIHTIKRFINGEQRKFVPLPINLTQPQAKKAYIGAPSDESFETLSEVKYLQNDKALLFVNTYKGGMYQLINASGQVIESGTLESGVVHKDVAYLPTGFYQVRLESENKTYHEKFVVR